VRRFHDAYAGIRNAPGGNAFQARTALSVERVVRFFYILRTLLFYAFIILRI